MPSVIDSFVIELGLDPTKFSQGQREALDAFKKTQDQAEKFGKAIESQGAKVNDFFGGLKREAIGLLGIFLAGRGIKEFTTYITTLDAATSRTALTLNMSTKELSAWQGAAEQAGGSAESITSTMQGLSGSVNTFLLTGQGSFVPIMNAMGLSLFDVNKKLKTSDQLLLEIADKVKGMDPARAAAMLSMIPGMNQDTLNLLLLGRPAIEAYLKAAREAGGTTAESAEAAKKYQENLTLLERSAVTLSRTLLTDLMPSLISILKLLREIVQANPFKGLTDLSLPKVGIVPDSPADKFKKFLYGWFSPGHYSIKDNIIGGSAEAAEVPAKAGTSAAGAASGAGSQTASSAEREAYIRKAAAARGIDPDQAVRVARSEGLGGSYIGDRGSSFGDFQLHYGGMAGGGMAVSGLGDKFTKKTGLDARDRSTWKEQVDFALDEAKKSGWGPWHGWKGLPYEGIGGLPTAGAAGAAAVSGGGGGAQRGGDQTSNTSSVHVGTVQVVAPNARNADDIAAEIPDAIKRANWAASANYEDTHRLMPDIPKVPGVPALASYAINTAILIVEDVASILLSDLFPQWGIFLNGLPVLFADSTISFEYRQDYPVSDYPVEGGGFQSYDKVQLPAEIKMRFATGGSVIARQAFLNSIDAVMDTTLLYDIVTPEKVYLDYNFTHRDFSRSASNGVGLIVVDLWLTEIRETSTATFSNTQQPSEAGQQAIGNVQPIAPSPALSFRLGNTDPSRPQIQ